MGNTNSKEVIEAIRKRPAMYTGSTSIRGFNELFGQIVNSFFDVARAKRFSFVLTGGCQGTFLFQDIGEKIFDDAALEFTRFQQSDFHGIELVVLNALSKYFIFRAFDDGGTELFNQRYEKGELKKGHINNLLFQAWRAEIDFELDDSIFVLTGPFNADFYLEEIKQLAYLHKGKTLSLDYPVAGEKYHAGFMFKDGLKDLIELEKLKRLTDTYLETYFEKQFESFSIEAAFCFRESSVDSPYLASYVNYDLTPEDGAHVKGLLEGLSDGIKKHLRKNDPSQKLNISKKPIRENLIAALHIKMKRPQFEGSCKNKLLSPEVIAPVAESIAQVFFEKLENDADSAGWIIRKLRR